MSILQRLKNDAMAYLGAGFKDKRLYVQTLIGEVDRKLGKTPTDEEVIGVLTAVLKTTNEMIAIKGEEEALLQEKEMLESYLPKIISGSTLEAVIRGIAAPSIKHLFIALIKDSKERGYLYDGKEAKDLFLKISKE